MNHNAVMTKILSFTTVLGVVMDQMSHQTITLLSCEKHEKHSSVKFVVSVLL